MSTVLLIAVFLCYSVYREILWQNERKDLYSRIMAKDLTEYREERKPIPPPKAQNSKFVTVRQKQHSLSKGGD
jgi:hypothetical protein